jgi:hypothetical protein
VYSVALSLIVNGALKECSIVTLPIILSRERPVAISVFSEIFVPKEGRITFFFPNRLSWCSVFLDKKIFMLFWDFELMSIHNVWKSMTQTIQS